jgi:phage baseplate assembly protein W
LTPKGSDPLRPDFALNIFDYVDKPVNSIRAPLVRDVIEAITRWEQRVTITKVSLESQEDLAGFILSVTWTLSGAVNQEPAQTTSVLVPTSGQLVTSPFVAIPFASTISLDEVDGGVL